MSPDAGAGPEGSYSPELPYGFLSMPGALVAATSAGPIDASPPGSAVGTFE